MQEISVFSKNPTTCKINFLSQSDFSLTQNSEHCLQWIFQFIVLCIIAEKRMRNVLFIIKNLMNTWQFLLASKVVKVTTVSFLHMGCKWFATTHCAAHPCMDYCLCCVCLILCLLTRVLDPSIIYWSLISSNLCACAFFQMCVLHLFSVNRAPTCMFQATDTFWLRCRLLLELGFTTL